LLSTEPEFNLYVTPIHIDPEHPAMAIGYPNVYPIYLAKRQGPYATLGLAEDTWGLSEDVLEDQHFLQQCSDIDHERETMFFDGLEKVPEGFCVCVFDGTDRMQHMFWRFREPEHPANRGGDFNPEFSHVIEDHYRTCDAVVGKAMQYADEQTLFIVLSDHGMNSFQRGIHLNTWLYNQGLLALQNGLIPGEETGDFFRGVDWSRTQAYALGLGGIYLNLKGREEKGIVSTDEAESIKTAIIKGLTGLGDPERGRVAVRSVSSREQIYSGPYVGEAPDLLVNFAEGYRVSWGTPLGGTPAGLFEDNIKKWGGDHMIDPMLAPGVLFMNQSFRGESPSLVDLAPTILAALGVPKGSAMEGSSLLV
ncbi:MAG: phosphodiesterase, partial [Anaerolineales bacterium]|nr:phosphodiesterase [Anaerolineales bacterium]